MQTFRTLERHLGLIPASIAQQLGAIDVGRGRQEAFRLQRPGVLETLRQIAVIQSVEASNAIEQITAPRTRIEKLVAERATPANRSEEEIAGYRSVLAAIHANARAMPFTPNVVLQLHRDLYQFTGARGGRWKGSDNTVTETLPTGEVLVRFVPVSAFRTGGAMDELHQRFALAWEAQTYPRLLLIAAYVLDFLVIHPFQDGNGRMARLLALLLLYQADYEVGRFISLEKLIEESKETYYEGLERATDGWHEGTHDLRPWTAYFLGILVAAYGRFEDRVGSVSGRGSKAELVKAFIRSNISDTFTVADIRRAVPGVSDSYLWRLFGELKRDGAIERIGAGRGSAWRRRRVDF
jgi:Fic family protein